METNIDHWPQLNLSKPEIQSQLLVFVADKKAVLIKFDPALIEKYFQVLLSEMLLLTQGKSAGWISLTILF
jgi:hypothetical protein